MKKTCRLKKVQENAIKITSILSLSTGDELNNLPMPSVEVEVYHVWWEFDTDTDTVPPL